MPRLLLHDVFFFFFSSRRRHTRSLCDWSSDVCSSDLVAELPVQRLITRVVAECVGHDGVVDGAPDGAGQVVRVVRGAPAGPVRELAHGLLVRDDRGEAGTWAGPSRAGRAARGPGGAPQRTEAP